MKISLLGVALGLCCLPTLLQAEAAAKVLFTQNQVFAQRGTGQHTLSRGSSIEIGDTVITKGNSLVNLRYTNGTLINLGENSQYKILAYAPTESVQLKTQLSQGKLNLQTTGKTKEEITTPIVALSIAGTGADILVTGNTTHCNVREGLIVAKSGSINGGNSALFTSNGMSYAPFPKEGTVTPPAGAQGTIAPTSSGSAGLSTSTNSTAIAVSSVQTTGAGSADTVSTGTQIVDFTLTCIPSV